MGRPIPIPVLEIAEEETKQKTLSEIYNAKRRIHLVADGKRGHSADSLKECPACKKSGRA